MNVRDSEVISGLLQTMNYELTANPSSADIIIFNTCSVRKHAEDKVWSDLGRFKGQSPAGTVPPRPPKEEIIKVMTAHLNFCIKCFGAKRAVPAFRKFFCWYTKGLDNVRPLRVEACAAATRKRMFEVISKI